MRYAEALRTQISYFRSQQKHISVATRQSIQSNGARRKYPPFHIAPEVDELIKYASDIVMFAWVFFEKCVSE